MLEHIFIKVNRWNCMSQKASDYLVMPWGRIFLCCLQTRTYGKCQTMRQNWLLFSIKYKQISHCWWCWKETDVSGNTKCQRKKLYWLVLSVQFTTDSSCRSEFACSNFVTNTMHCVLTHTNYYITLYCIPFLQKAWH